MKYGLAPLLMLCFLSPSAAQSSYEFTSGLVVSQCHRYGREAIVTDEIAYQLATKSFRSPRAGQPLVSGNESAWQSIDVDRTGRFRGEPLRNGYLYLTYQSDREIGALLNIAGNSMCYVNGEPRGGDIYNDGWMNLPVRLRKGLNEILVRCSNFSRFQGVKARLLFPEKSVFISTDDTTLPHVIVDASQDTLFGGIVVANVSARTLTGLIIRAEMNGRAMETSIASVPSYSTRKVAFRFKSGTVPARGQYDCQLQLRQNTRILHEQSIVIDAVEPDAHRSHTFVSEIDGSVQYYGVAPYRGDTLAKPALFLSVHGAGVEAIGQARAYQPKDWGVVVAPTNRRPRGFNWEDWGRIDALEVYNIAIRRFAPDPGRIYLTGHSMGGHGTWYLGATYPDKWAAIAPCAGYPTLSVYGSADGRIPDSARTEEETILLRASNPSQVTELAANYKHHGIYVFHGDADPVVPVRFARQMRELLGTFHPDFAYYEYPGGSHWFGNESVDWPPLFDFFRSHTRKPDSLVHTIHFITANPAISSSSRWVSVIQQTEPLLFSEVDLTRDVNKRAISGTTRNVGMLRLDLSHFPKGEEVSITLDSQTVAVSVAQRDVYLARTDKGWETSMKPGADQKNASRGGTLKEAFNHRMIFVYATRGNAAEDSWAYNKARYDAEVWYYRGNGAVDVIADVDFAPSAFPDRGVILYGNASNNAAWNSLLADCPIQVTRSQISVGTTSFKGDDLGAYFVWPRRDSDIASVGVVTGTGLTGLHATEANQYFAGGSGFPDYVVFSADMLRMGAGGVKAAGFYDNRWSIRGANADRHGK